MLLLLRHANTPPGRSPRRPRTGPRIQKKLRHVPPTPAFRAIGQQILLIRTMPLFDSLFSKSPPPPQSSVPSIGAVSASVAAVGTAARAKLPNFSKNLLRDLQLRAPPLYILIGAASFSSLILLRSLTSSTPREAKAIPSPRETLPPEVLRASPYPPDALDGARDVSTPYGSIRVYEWGPKDGKRVLLIHGMSTPSVALSDLAYKLVKKGCRVMLFGKSLLLTSLDECTFRGTSSYLQTTYLSS